MSDASRDGESPPGKSQALASIRVLDLTQYIAGPFCTKLMADFGAEVIKVEPPGAGDVSRGYGPFKYGLPDREASGLYLYCNTNKKSITLDIETDTGREIARRLASQVDVVVESFPPGRMAALGLGYEALSASNPRLVMLSISMFGQDGPWRDWKADEVNLHAISGLMSITGDPDREPLKNGGHQALYNTGINAFTAVTVAIYAQQTLGVGQHVDVSAYETMSFLLEPPRVLQASQQGTFTERVGNKTTLLPAADGHVNVIRGGSGVFVEVLAKVTGNEAFVAPHLRNAPLVGPGAAEANEEIEALLMPWTIEHGKEEFYHAGQAGGQNFGYVASPEDMLNSPHLKAREYYVEVDHPVAGRLAYPGAPFKMSDSPWRAGRAPLLGEHNEEVYSGMLGYSRADMADLSRAGVI
jgi:crotonobetainyl-CoA:carnitine CoA-transferase CaiB-like acyl-CoA transferase